MPQVRQYSHIGRWLVFSRVLWRRLNGKCAVWGSLQHVRILWRSNWGWIRGCLWEECKICVRACGVWQRSGGRTRGVQGHVHGGVSKLEGVAWWETDVGAGVNWGQSWRDGTVACRGGRSTATKLYWSWASDGAHGRVPTVWFVPTPREELGFDLTQFHSRVKEVLKLLTRPVWVLREDRFNLISAESRQVNFAESFLHVSETIVSEWAGVGEGVRVGRRVLGGRNKGRGMP